MCALRKDVPFLWRVEVSWKWSFDITLTQMIDVVQGIVITVVVDSSAPLKLVPALCEREVPWYQIFGRNLQIDEVVAAVLVWRVARSSAQIPVASSASRSLGKRNLPDAAPVSQLIDTRSPNHELGTMKCMGTAHGWFGLCPSLLGQTLKEKNGQPKK